MRRVADALLDPVVRHPDIQLLLLRMSNASEADDDTDAEPGEPPANSAAVTGDAQADAAAWEARRLGTAAARLLAGIGVPQQP
jgi:hypothetical protein